MPQRRQVASAGRPRRSVDAAGVNWGSNVEAESPRTDQRLDNMPEFAGIGCCLGAVSPASSGIRAGKVRHGRQTDGRADAR